MHVGVEMGVSCAQGVMTALSPLRTSVIYSCERHRRAAAQRPDGGSAAFYPGQIRNRTERCTQRHPIAGPWGARRWRGACGLTPRRGCRSTSFMSRKTNVQHERPARYPGAACCTAAHRRAVPRHAKAAPGGGFSLCILAQHPPGPDPGAPGHRRPRVGPEPMPRDAPLFLLLFPKRDRARRAGMRRCQDLRFFLFRLLHFAVAAPVIAFSHHDLTV